VKKVTRLSHLSQLSQVLSAVFLDYDRKFHLQVRHGNYLSSGLCSSPDRLGIPVPRALTDFHPRIIDNSRCILLRTTVIPMSATSQTTNRSTSNFTAIFDAASNRYKSLTGQDLRTHPFAAALNNSTSPDSILNVFRNQAEAYNKFHKGNDKLMAWLTPIVHILFTFSGSLGEGIGLVRHHSLHTTVLPHLF